MLNPKARPSITAFWSSDRASVGGVGKGLTRTAILSVLVHATLIIALIWRPNFRVQPVQPEVAAQIELTLGNDAEHDGAPPPPAAAAQPQQPDAKPSPRQEATVKADGIGPQPRPTPPAQVPPPMQRSANPSPKTDIHLGTGIAAPAAEFENPLQHVEAAANPNNVAPVYPLNAARRIEEGLVVILLYIDKTGAVDHVELAQSSGFANLDQAALDALSRWHFRPAFHDGVAVPSVKQQMVDFRRQ